MAKPQRVRGDYHPGNLTADAPFKQDAEPPMSHREVEYGNRKPVLYDAQERPIYRRAGYAPKERG